MKSFKIKHATNLTTEISMFTGLLHTCSLFTTHLERKSMIDRQKRGTQQRLFIHIQEISVFQVFCLFLLFLHCFVFPKRM